MTRTTVKVLMVLLMGLLILPGCSQELAQPQLQQRTASDEALSLGLLIDISADGRIRKQFATTGLHPFLESLSPNDEIALVEIGDQPRTVLAFTSDQRVIQTAMMGVEQASTPVLVAKAMTVLLALSPAGVGAVPLGLGLNMYEWRQAQIKARTKQLYAGIVAGLRLMSQGGHARKALILMTDGRDELQSVSLAEVVASARQSRIPIYAIGMGRDGSWLTPAKEVRTRTLEQLSGQTHGSYFTFNTDDKEASYRVLAQALEEISRDLRAPQPGGVTYVYNPQLNVFDHIAITPGAQTNP